MSIIGAIDIGSNAMRLSVAQFSNKGDFTVLANVREPVRLGQDVFRFGKLRAPTMERAVAAILQFNRILQAHQVRMVRAVGTSALRDAANASELIERVKRATGLELEAISGEEEARLIYLAVSSAVGLSRGNTLLVDIGGGSVELSLVRSGQLIFSDSSPMGTVRLLERLKGQKVSPQLLEKTVSRFASGIQRQTHRGLAGKRIHRVVGTGGNIEAFADLKRQLKGGGNSREIRLSELKTIVEMVNEHSYRARTVKLGLRPDRADVIVPAGALLLSIMKEAQAEVLVVPKVGLRDGVMIDLFQRLSEPERPKPLVRRAEQVLAYAVELGRRFSFDEPHALHASWLALQIFDQTKGIHGLNGEGRVLLELAAILHDVGHSIDGREHHKHSFYIIRETPFPGLGDEQKLVVALMARHHRGPQAIERSSEWTELSAAGKRIASLGAAILRVVEALDKEHGSRISRVLFSRSRSGLMLRLRGRGSLLVERLSVERKKDMLERVLKRPIAVVPC